ncbi:MAG: hypothetical protein LUG91_09715 [Ruminococcus sp.]|nr:hypothetical protein [Ruminococcus sp.]
MLSAFSPTPFKNNLNAFKTIVFQKAFTLLHLPISDRFCFSGWHLVPIKKYGLFSLFKVKKALFHGISGHVRGFKGF